MKSRRYPFPGSGAAFCEEDVTEHAYPDDLALFISDQWERTIIPPEQQDARGVCEQDPLPELAVLRRLLSICYQAGQMREEDRPVKFRLLFGSPDRFPSEDGPPAGLHRVLFLEPRPLSEHELRRLSPAAHYDRSLIGVTLDENRRLVIWGIIHSGSRWLYAVRGGRGTPPPMPACLNVAVGIPGQVAVFKGSVLIGKLEAGKITGRAMHVFHSAWLPAVFAPIRAELIELHNAARRQAGCKWAVLDDKVITTVAQHMVKRLISVVRSSRHGATLIFIPPGLADEVYQRDHYIYLKYKLTEEEPRARFRTLILDIMNNLVEGGSTDGTTSKPITLDNYVHATSEAIATLDEGVFELSHLVAGMAAVDGAVAVTNCFEVLGFGGEIRGNLPDIHTIARACDIEGERKQIESIEGVGTRHRSAYRLCHALHDALAIVVSQDGGVCFIKWHEGIVTCWDHEAISR